MVRAAAMDDQTFGRVVDSPQFQQRWRGRVHPLLRSNGGIEFHNIESLTERLQHAERQKAMGPKWGLSGWSRDRYPSVLRDWLRQVEWIANHAD